MSHEGFFATHFFTVSAKDKSTHFYVRILGGKDYVSIRSTH